jgi:hypothetical protein
MAENLVQGTGAGSETQPDTKAQLAQYLAQQPPSKRTFDKVMKGLELAWLVVVAGYVAWAIYVSIYWSIPGKIAAVWLGTPVAISILLVLIGVHAGGLGAFFPVVMPGGTQPLTTGSKAVGTGIGFAVTTAIAGAFWGTFAWGVWTNDWALLAPLVKIIAAVVGVGVVVAIASDLHRRFFQSR